MADEVDNCDNSASDANTILSGMKKWNNLHKKPKVPFLNTYEKQVTRHKLFKFSVKKEECFFARLQKFGLHGVKTAIFLSQL